MGSTLASLHVYAPAPAAGASAISPDSVAKSAANLLGYDLVNDSDNAERQLVAVGVPPWLSFFDLTGPPAITEESVDLGKQLSAGSGCPVLLTSVLDSDAFAFVVFEKGKQVDAHASMSGVLPGRMKKWPAIKRA